MKHSKVAIIGAGSVGSTTAYALIMRNIVAEILLVDINELRCKGEMLDLSDTIPFSWTSQITHASLQDARHADIIIIAAGVAQQPNQKRTELWNTNRTIITKIITDMKPINPQAIIIVVSNPLDLITLLIQEISELPRHQIFGTGTFLDTQRLRNLISAKINIAEQSIHVYVLGEHGDAQFVAWSTAQIAGIPLKQFSNLTRKELDSFTQQARNRAYEIIACKGATFFGIAACVSAICKDILFNQKRTLPLSCYQENLRVCLSMPVVLGEQGIEQILSISLNDEEQHLLEKSAQSLRMTY